MKNLKPIHVAITDDHTIVRQGFVMLLTAQGFIVDFEAENGKELLDKLEQHIDLPDVCILDIFMPVMNGVDALISLRKKWPKLPVMVLTIGDNETMVKRMIFEGANGYLVKHCQAEELKKGLETIHNSGIHFSQKVNLQLYKAVKNGEMRIHNLTPTELQIVEYCCIDPDLSYEEIGEKLNLSKKSVEGHRDTIFKKCDVHSRAGLLKFALQNGLITFNML